MFHINLVKPRHWVVLLSVFSLFGCGAAQTVSDGASSAFTAIFYKKIKELHLDFTAREELNTDELEHNSLSQAVMLRVYQLKDRTVFEKATYQQLLSDGEKVLSNDLMSTYDVVIKPGADISLNRIMEKEAQFVGVVGFFRQPNMEDDTWKLVIARDELDPDEPRVIEVGNTYLKLQPFEED